MSCGGAPIVLPRKTLFLLKSDARQIVPAAPHVVRLSGRRRAPVRGGSSAIVF
jgi:hypothetical protein